jgi:hypothetical protein
MSEQLDAHSPRQITHSVAIEKAVQQAMATREAQEQAEPLDMKETFDYFRQLYLYFLADWEVLEEYEPRLKFMFPA